MEENKVYDVKWSRAKKLYYTRKEGNPYFMHHGRRYHLSNFMRAQGIDSHLIHGYMGISNSMAMVLSISDDTESVKIAYIG